MEPPPPDLDAVLGLAGHHHHTEEKPKVDIFKVAFARAQQIKEKNQREKYVRFFDLSKSLKHNPVSDCQFKIVSPKHKRKIEFKDDSQFADLKTQFEEVMSIGGPESHELVANPFHYAKLKKLKKAQEAK